jgi:hypothetical protein
MVREGVVTIGDAARFSIAEEEDARDSRQWRNWLAAVRRRVKMPESSAAL